MSFLKAIAKAYMQLKHLYWECLFPRNCIHVSGDLHLNVRHFDFMQHNLGDDLNLPLLHALTGRHVIPVKYSLLSRHAHPFLAIGSIISQFASKQADIWGAGLIEPLSQAIPTPRNIYAVRGPKTREELLRFHISCPEIYGDPACLMPRIFRPRQSQHISLGIIPHVTELGLPILTQWQRQGALIINVKDYGDWHDFIRRLCSCQVIISSSLHGLILADAYGIPSQRLILSDGVIGGDFKYLDYYSAFRKHIPAPLTPDLPLEEMRSQAADTWEPLPDAIPEQLLQAFPCSLRPDFQQQG